MPGTNLYGCTNIQIGAYVLLAKLMEIDDKCLYLGIDDYSHENLKNYLITQAMLSSRVDGDSHKWIDAKNQGKTDELIRKKKSRRSHSAPPFTKARRKSLS
uniref:Uncharacterized protein n=1 Tax=Solanum lycopersicum TaxID=4081 RepID=A0A3Q7FD46_SOLLC